MNGLQLLKTIKQINSTIESLQEEIEILYTSLTSTTVKPKEINVQSSISGDKITDKMANIIEYQQKIEELQNDLIDKKIKVIDTLKLLDEADQQILILRYFRGLSIENVAEIKEWSYFWCWQKCKAAEDNFSERFVIS